MTDLSYLLVRRLVAAISAGAIDPTGDRPNSNSSAQVWAAIERRLDADRLAAATLLLFASAPGSADMQGRLAQVLAQYLPAEELRAHLVACDDDDAPAVRAHVSADEEALIEPSSYEVLAPPDPVDLETGAGQHGRVVDSPISVIGAGASIPAGPSVSPAGRDPLPATLSADGVRFSYGHALIIGVGQYRDPAIADVATTANDARALAELLRDPQLGGYPPGQVRVLVDAKATRATILDALAELAQRAAGGTALIFFAGHGEPTGGGYALLPSDAELERLEETAITAELFQQRVAKIRTSAARLIVLLNCCYAGGGGDAVLGAAGAALSGTAPPPEFYRPLAVGSGQVVISSSRPAQKSGAHSRRNPRHTTFGTQLLAALRGAAPGAGPAVGVFELFAYLRATVPADARQTIYQRQPLRQEPLFYAGQLDDNLAVALRPPGAGTALDADDADLVARLVALELQIEALGVAAPADLLAERDAALARIAGGA
jgi:metacaspase-1